jgi:hypothetical protein
MKLYNVGDDSDLASDLDFLEEDASVGVFDNKNRISKFSEFY